MRIGVDLGGTKIEAVGLTDDGQEQGRRRISTPVGDYSGTVSAIARLVADVERQTGPARGIGIGIPGTVSPATGLIKNANSTWLIGRPFDADLGAALGRPVRLANDANCFAASEAADGAAAGESVVFGAILGTGVGGGVVIDGKTLVGRNAIAGEWGHTTLPARREDERPGPVCYCGRSGCIETFLSGPALARDLAGNVDDEADAAAVAAAAMAGDARAIAAMDRYVERLARALGPVINLIDPDVIVLGGGLSNIDRLYADVPARWGQWVFSDRVETPLRRARHGDSSGVRGAARLWP